MSKIVNDALADAQELIKLAESNAKSAIVETFQPTIQRLISTKLAEEDDELEDEELPNEDPTVAVEPEVPVEPVADVAVAPPAPEAPVEDPALEAEPLVDVPAEEEEDEDAAYEAIVRELNTVSETDDPIADDEELNIDDLELEAFIRKIREGDDCNDEDDSKDMTMEAQIKKLKKENTDLAKANILMKNAIQEAVLLNTKLMYSIQIGREYGLNESEKITVFKALDKAKSINEVKLVHSTLTESFKTSKKQLKKDAAISKPSIAKNMASRSQPVVQSNKTAVNESVEKIKNRWQILSGQQKIKY